MRSLLFAAVLALAAPAFAQVRVQVALPSIHFSTAPRTVAVAPGVQVVEDSDDEVFFADGYYWHHRGPNWFRMRRYDGGWTVVDRERVPRAIVGVPEGRYRNWRHDDRERRQELREHERRDEHMRREERREDMRREEHRR